MKENVKDAIEEYQCSGCMSGCDISCFEPDTTRETAACGGHRAGTLISGIGKIFLGMPKGFNRLGVGFGGDENLKLDIFEKYEDGWGEGPTGYTKWNIPVWKYKNKEGHTIIRGLSPRNNRPFLQVFLEDCMDKFNCLEITQEDVDAMD